MPALSPKLVHVRTWSTADGEVASRVGTAPESANAVGHP
jgi:hypothetical protein